MKILLAGNWEWEQYEPACAESLGKLGHEVIPFRFADFFAGRYGRYQSAVAAFPGPASIALNQRLTALVKQTRPDAVLIWRGTHVWPSTLRRIKHAKILLVSYNNDDPFGPRVHRLAPWHHRYLWTWYIKGLQHYDLSFFYRQINVVEATAIGASNARVLLPYFIPQRHRAMQLSVDERRKYECDIVFVGHYEPDGRELYLRALVRAGLNVKLFGGSYWTREVLGDTADYFGKVRPVYGDDYPKALSGARMCLAFLSRMNRDTYTRRCFEIPACGRLLLCERTADLQAIFAEDREAVYFSSPEELVVKALRLRDAPAMIQRIAEAGAERAVRDGHDVDSRMRKLARDIESFRLVRREATPGVCA